MKVKMAIEFELDLPTLNEPGANPEQEIRKVFTLLKTAYDSQPNQFVRMTGQYDWITEKRSEEYDGSYPLFVCAEEE